MKFILSKELGRLAKWLRILGFDTVYFNENKAGSLIIQALKDDRIILTRNSHIRRMTGIKTLLLKSEKLNEQFSELKREIGLKSDPALMFTRCIVCNVELKSIGKQAVKDMVPEYVFSTQEDFVACPQCKRIYWQGTHWGNVEKLLKELTE